MFQFNFSFKFGKDTATSSLEVSSFLKEAEAIAVSVRQEKRFSTASNYMTALKSFRRFCSSTGEDKGSMTTRRILDYQEWLLASGICYNTIGCYLRSLRAIYNRIKANNGQAKRHSDIFSEVSTRPCQTEKRAIRPEDMRALMDVELENMPKLAFARHLFLFSFYCMGMPFIDMAYLRKKDIRGDVIVYHRRKTGIRVRVAIEPCIQEIIDIYDREGSEFIFPILSSHDEAEQYQEAQRELRRFNYNLKKLSDLANIRPGLSSYVARHTWASIAFSREIGINTISQALGHASPKITTIYIKDLHTDQLRNANRKVLDI